MTTREGDVRSAQACLRPERPQPTAEASFRTPAQARISVNRHHPANPWVKTHPTFCPQARTGGPSSALAASPETCPRGSRPSPLPPSSPHGRAKFHLGRQTNAAHLSHREHRASHLPCHCEERSNAAISSTDRLALCSLILFLPGNSFASPASVCICASDAPTGTPGRTRSRVSMLQAARRLGPLARHAPHHPPWPILPARDTLYI